MIKKRRDTWCGHMVRHPVRHMEHHGASNGAPHMMHHKAHQTPQNVEHHVCDVQQFWGIYVAGTKDLPEGRQLFALVWPKAPHWL